MVAYRSIFLFLFLFLRGLGFSQSSDSILPVQPPAPQFDSVVWQIKETLDENYGKGKTSFIWFFRGFADSSHAASFAKSIRDQEPNFKTAIITGPKNGWFTMTFSVKEEKDMQWYYRLFSRLGIKYLLVNRRRSNLKDLIVN